MPKQFVSSERYTQSTGVVCRKIADETLLVPIRGGVGDLNAIYSFNSLGSELWEQMREGASVKDLTDWVTQHYEVSYEQALFDVELFLIELRDAGLVLEAPTHLSASVSNSPTQTSRTIPVREG